jgi:hypothetical protein
MGKQVNMIILSSAIHRNLLEKSEGRKRNNRKKMWLVNEDLYIVKKSLDEEMNIFDLNYNVL